MTIALVGGGSGGHITPILAVADELKSKRPDVHLVYIGQKGDALAEIPAAAASIDKSYSIHAGKFRRYHGEGWRLFFDVPTLFKNIRDFFLVVAGLWQSYWLLRRLKPAVIFTPGGYVGVPVGIASKLRSIPFVTHDLDSLPGLANRINSRWAVVHAVGMPKELYPYPLDKTEYVGVPTSREFKPVNKDTLLSYKRELGLENYGQMIFIIGGGLGAQRINEAVLSISKQLLAAYPELVIVHTVGLKHAESMEKAYATVLDPEISKRVLVKGYLDDVYRYSGAADLIITRAGATNIAEFAVQQKACIVIPNPVLTGGHQVKNADYLAKAGAIKLVPEDNLVENSNLLLSAIKELLDNPSARESLGKKLGAYARPEAASKLANILLKVVGQGNET